MKVYDVLKIRKGWKHYKINDNICDYEQALLHSEEEVVYTRTDFATQTFIIKTDNAKVSGK